jgi:3-hydroxyisobutyrate dehydrogenase-like beta-hydroxyacid dehydrogenase
MNVAILGAGGMGAAMAERLSETGHGVSDGL